MHTRPALRELQPDERVLRWWVGTRRHTWWLLPVTIIMRLLPDSGARASDRLTGFGSALVIETDRRLLVLAGHDANGVLLEEPMHRVAITTRQKRVIITHPGGEMSLKRVWSGGRRP